MQTIKKNNKNTEFVELYNFEGNLVYVYISNPQLEPVFKQR
jgi:hypothetical protein